ncbi:Serine-threonine/tyrosine-protein kinase, catalytic domain [Sesbania bispinosa]|nr:Serine-threonine/tyrosine-protein kinase, catalytic domain [Sesbania bispinosa]
MVIMLEFTKWTPFVLAFLLYVGKESFATYTPVDNYLVACGSSNNINFQGRTFIPDSEYPNLKIIANKSMTITSKLTVPSPLYQSARLFSGNASYFFKIQQHGMHWIRLYFHPFPNSNHNMNFASITVVTDSFVLLDYFTFMNYRDSHLFKEYAISVTSNELFLKFISHHNSLVFVNAIEVVSMPDVLFPDNLKSFTPFTVPSEFFLETVYRLNVGGESISAENDTLDRSWESDETYFHSTSTAINISTNISAIKHPDFLPITAPPLVYATAKALGSVFAESNLNWVFHISPDFLYFVRVHFCDIISKSPNSLVLNLFINGRITLGNFDLSSLSGDLAEPYFKDFVFYSSGETMTVSVGPALMSNYTLQNATMNGLEILKISNKFSGLDGFSSVESVLTKSSQISKKIKSVIVIGFSVTVLTFLVLLGLSFCYLKARRLKKKSAITFEFLRHFTFHEIQQATNDFDPNLLIGEGGFGNVYKGTLENGKTVAIKVANPESRQGLNEFHNEIELLSGLRHQNLVSLVGCCSEDSELILVYNFMANGSLSSHLYGRDFVPLSWKQRLEICIGAAKGLCYLHIGARQGVIHRDVKAANILLDENLVPKVADFGISKKGPLLDKSHVTTNVKGSFGYVDPEYFRTKYLTKKSDVYSFGVVLIEVICGKPALDDARPTQQMNLALWALSCHGKGTFYEMMDPYLSGKVNMDSLKKVSELAWKCLEERRVNRPPMGYVLCELEEALHLELASQVLNHEGDSVTNASVENGFTDDIENVA